MEIQVYLAFVVATAIMIALPGPSVLLTVAHSISFGWQHALSTGTDRIRWLNDSGKSEYLAKKTDIRLAGTAK